jgi:hypothetical protein
VNSAAPAARRMVRPSCQTCQSPPISPLAAAASTRITFPALVVMNSWPPPAMTVLTRAPSGIWYSRSVTPSA